MGGVFQEEALYHVHTDKEEESYITIGFLQHDQKELCLPARHRKGERSLLHHYLFTR